MNLDQLWQDAIKALHAGKGITRADLDAFIYDETKGAIRSFAHLAQARAQQERVRLSQEQQDIAEPSALGAGTVAAGNALSLGLVNRLQRALGDTGTQDYMEAGAEARPWADFAGSVAGGIPPAILMAEAMAGPAGAALARVPGFTGLNPLGQAAIKAGTVGAGVGGASSYLQGDLLSPDPAAIAKDAGLGFALGAPIGLGAAWKGMKLAPSEHLMEKALEQSTPSTRPSLMGGVKAIREGEVTPSGAASGGEPMPVLSDAAAARLSEVLRPLNFEKSPSLRALGAKRIIESPEAAAQAENALRARMKAIIKEKQTISNDLKTGYDAILEGAPIQNPAAAEIFAKYKFTKPVTGRSVFDLEQKLSRQSDHMFKVKEGGKSVVDITAADDLATDAARLRSMLGEEVSGFNELQARVAPYIQRQGQLRIAMRQVVGRAIKPRGKAPQAPKGSTMHEGLPESVGFGKDEITERAARELVNPLFRSSETGDLVDFVKHKGSIPKLLATRSAATAVGAAQGAAQSRTRYGRKVRGLFSWPVLAEAQ